MVSSHFTRRTSATEKLCWRDNFSSHNIIKVNKMNNSTIRNARHTSLFIDSVLTKETQEYNCSQKSRSLANLEELLFHAIRYRKCGDVLPLKNLCVRLRHPLKSLNNSRLDWMVNEICFHEDDRLPATFTQSLEMHCRQLIDEIRVK